MKRLFKKLLTRWHTFRALRRVPSHGDRIFVNFKSTFTRNTVLGNNDHFNGMHISGNGRVTIGDNFHSGKRVEILTSYHNYDGGNALPYDDTLITRDVTIGDNVWVGQDVTILAGSSIGEGAVIQAGSVVAGNIPACAVAGGHPAKVFKMRDLVHYEKLKAEGRFF